MVLPTGLLAVDLVATPTGHQISLSGLHLAPNVPLPGAGATAFAALVAASARRRRRGDAHGTVRPTPSVS